MIIANQPVEDYAHHLVVDVDATVTGFSPFHYSFTASLVGTWGNPYSDTPSAKHGWMITWTNRWHAGAFSYELTLRIPQLSLTQTYTGAGWINPETIDLEFFAQRLITDCSAWTVEWTGLDLTLGGVSKYSDAVAVSLSGTGFDPDENTVYLVDAPVPSLLGPPEIPGCLSCPSVPTSWTNTLVEIAGTCEFWWTHTATTEDIEFEIDQSIPTQKCSCAESLSAGYPSENGSHHVVVPVYSIEEAERVEVGPGVCLCDGVFLYDYPVGHYTSRWVALATTAHADPLSGPNRKTIETSGSRCWSSGGAPAFTESTPTITSRTHQLSRYRVTIVAVLSDVYCPEPETSPPICVPGIHEWEEGILSCTEYPDCTGCKYEAYIELAWQDTPCNCLSAELHLTRSQGGPLLATKTSSGALGVHRMNLRGMAETISTGVTGATHAQIAFSPRGRSLVAFEKAGLPGPVQRVWTLESASWGSRFSTPVEIGAGTWPAPCIEPETGLQWLAYHDGARWQLLRRLEDHIAWTNIGNFGAGAAGRCCIETSPDRDGIGLIAFIQGGNAYVLEFSRKGDNLGTPTLVAAATMLALSICRETGIQYLALRVASEWRLWRRKPREASFSNISAISTYGAFEVGLEVHPSRSHELVFLYNDCGLPTPILSSSHGDRWPA